MPGSRPYLQKNHVARVWEKKIRSNSKIESKTFKITHTHTKSNCYNYKISRITILLNYTRD